MLFLNNASKSVVPIREEMVSIDSNKNNDPNNVYKNKKKLALTLLFEPYNPININKGGSILSKKI